MSDHASQSSSALRISHVVGFDDAPFARDERGTVDVIGAMFADNRLEGILRGRVQRDGSDATDVLAQLITSSRYYAHLHAVMLQGISLAGFNVVDIKRLNTSIDRPVLVVCRKQPDMTAIRNALLEHIEDGAAKWRLIEQAGEMENIDKLYVQRAGLDMETAALLLQRFCFNSDMPEPLRTAHLIAAGITPGDSRQRV
jgi:endonuclease V-like protein UPF0215 family